MMRFRLWVVLGGVVLAAAACQQDEAPVDEAVDGAAAAAAEAEGVPVARCAQPVHDFGSVVRGRPLRHTFSVHNAGTAPLRILRTRAGCNCTATMVDGPTIAPGGNTGVEVRLSTRGMKGAIKKTVTLVTDDPAQPELELTLQGEVEVLLAFQPERLFLGPLREGSSRSEVVAVTGSRLAAFEPGTPRSDKPERLSARWLEGAGAPRLEVTFTAGHERGRQAARLELPTGLEQPERIALTVSARVTGDLVAGRRYVLFAPYTEDDEAVVRVDLRSLSNEPFEVTAIEDPAAAVEGTAERIDGGWRISLRLSRKPEQRRGRVIVRTDRADQPELSIAYHVRGPRGQRPHTVRGQLQQRGPRVRGPARLRTPQPVGPAEAAPIRIRADQRRHPVRARKVEPEAERGGARSPAP
jgi:hypothetical protein